MDDLVGVPFVYGGRGPDSYDCYGLVMECWRRAHGVELPDFLSPSDQGAQAAVGAIKLTQWTEVPRAAGVMVAIRVGRLVSHCGFMLDENTMIHAWNKTGGVTVIPLDRLEMHIAGFYTYAR